VRWILTWFWFAFPLWPGLLNISSFVFLSICTSSFEKAVQFICPFLLWVIFWEFRFLSFLNILVINQCFTMFIVEVFQFLRFILRYFSSFLRLLWMELFSWSHSQSAHY
jgi:hypothetical protein